MNAAEKQTVREALEWHIKRCESCNENEECCFVSPQDVYPNRQIDKSKQALAILDREEAETMGDNECKYCGANTRREHDPNCGVYNAIPQGDFVILPLPWFVDPDERDEKSWNNHITAANGNRICFMSAPSNPQAAKELERAAKLICDSVNSYAAAPKPQPESADASDAKVMRLWRESGLPEYFLGNGGTNHKLEAFASLIRADALEEAIVGRPQDVDAFNYGKNFSRGWNDCTAKYVSVLRSLKPTGAA